jgi:GMP synthase (glutamine-hydrolysing)
MQKENIPATKRPLLIIDFGSQYSMLIARRIRELEVYCEVLPASTNLQSITSLNPIGIILSGGPASVYEENAPLTSLELLESSIPILGICYGMQLIVHQLGGSVYPSKAREYGKAQLSKTTNKSILFEGMPKEMQVWMSHGDKVETLPKGFNIIAETNNSPFAATSNNNNKFGIQFHPEVVHTPVGKQILENFVFKICRASRNWSADQFIQESIKKIRDQVGDNQVICGLSGGVDSAVAASLVHRAIGNKLTCIFVDNGLLRKYEAAQIIKTFKETMEIPLVHVEAGNSFLAKLTGVTDPEQKRKIIGNEFINIFEQEATKLGNSKFLVQGTTYPDVIESMADDNGTGAVIKSHHNVGGLPDNMNLGLVEPVRNLFKDEVRLVGQSLGLPEHIVWRQPFPGPGLAIRILGEITLQKLQTLRDADLVVTEEIEKANLTRKIWQSFAVLTSSKTVGVMGDDRTYENVVAIRSVSSEDAMTADWSRLPYSVLETISNRIINEVPNVNRVVYDITSKPPGTIEWE